MNKAIERFSSRQFGVFNHYLNGIQNNPEHPTSKGRPSLPWNEHVNLFDAEKLAWQLNKIGAGYYCITLMQGTPHLIAPNETFDKIAGTKPGEACSFRDLPLDIYEALKKYDIDLFLYYTGDGPWKTKEGEKFGFTAEYGKIPEGFVDKWAAVLEEYALRYGDKVKGWWIDGCYRKERGFDYSDEMLAKYEKACKKGNPDALVACNNGVKWFVEKNYINEDFVAGENVDFGCAVPTKKFIDGALAHIFAPMGVAFDYGAWGKAGVKFDNDYLLTFVKKCSEVGAPVTFDAAVYADGSLDPAQMSQLEYISRGLGRIK